jgi:hypothetical protein
MQQEITRRVEFLFENAAGRACATKHTPQYPPAKITMVRPICARGNNYWTSYPERRLAQAARAALSDRDGNFLRDHRRIERKVVGIAEHELERVPCQVGSSIRASVWPRAEMKV